MTCVLARTRIIFKASPMNIDERLTALTQSVELLASFHKDNEKRMERFQTQMERFQTQMERFQTQMERFAEEMKGLGKRHAQLEGFVTEIAEGTARLLHAVEAHEHRLSDLEGNQTRQ